MKSISEGIVISPIKNGTVIDHIAPGKGLKVIQILGIQDRTNVTFTVATNVTSNHKPGRKDLVKIENRELIESEVNKITLISPDATISIIRDFKVVSKKSVSLPKSIIGVIKCPNPNCITNAQEPIKSRFIVNSRGYRCQYCNTMLY
ncbi:MAG TPA: aspartate carbamoyltransferase regulatory subunit, partial [Methanocorpusculum sp.]|nr:aspartate carbamoyltransferase regulatory subunit [Methanocorpusculum sp.]